MTQKAKVVELNGRFATVEVTRSSACDGCHKQAEGGCAACALIGGQNTMRTRAHNSVGAAVGDVVTVEASSSRTVGYALLVFLFPIIAAAAGYAVASWAGALPDASVLWAFGAFGAAVLAVWAISRFVLSGRCDVYITEVLSGAEPGNTEDKQN